MVRHFRNTNELKRAIQYLVCASVRITIAGPPAGTLEQAIARIAPLIHNGTIKTAVNLADEMVAGGIVPVDEAFKVAFRTATVSKTNLAKYYLRCLENANAKDSAPWYVRKELTGSLEHVLPQSASLPEPWKFWAPDDHKAYRRRIGNLALLGPKDNSNIGNGDFLTVKVPVYAKSPIALTASIADKQSWTKKEIDERQEELTQLAVNAWPLKLK